MASSLGHQLPHTGVKLLIEEHELGSLLRGQKLSQPLSLLLVQPFRRSSLGLELVECAAHFIVVYGLFGKRLSQALHRLSSLCASFLVLTPEIAHDCFQFADLMVVQLE